MQIEEKIHLIGGLGFWAKKIDLGPGPADPTLVFLHDALGCTATWKDFPEQLCEKMNLNGLVYDRQGHGQSDPLDRTRPLDYLEKEALVTLPAILEHFKIKKKILIGHSDGASIALLYESEFQSTDALVSMAGHIKVEPLTLEEIKKAKKDFEKPFYIEKLKNYHGFKTRKLIDDWAETWLSEDFKNWNIGSNLRSIKCPVLAMQGKEDAYATDGHLFEIKNNIGDHAIAMLLKNCSHFPHKEKPKETIKAIKYFLAKTTQNSLTP